jgi:hypothetical protein
VFRLLPDVAADAAWILPEEKLLALKGGVANLYHQLQSGCCRSYAAPSDGRSWNWYGHIAISLKPTVMTFITMVNQTSSRLSSFIIQYNRCVDCYRPSAFFFFCIEFSFTIMEADSSCNIYIILIIPDYPLEYVYLHISTDLRINPLFFITLNSSVLMAKTVQWQLSPNIKLKFSK